MPEPIDRPYKIQSLVIRENVIETIAKIMDEHINNSKIFPEELMNIKSRLLVNIENIRGYYAPPIEPEALMIKPDSVRNLTDEEAEILDKMMYSGAIDTGVSLFEEIGDRPKTNADRIRHMTDEEELLSAIGTSCYRCIYSNGQCDSGYGEGCIAGNLEWLKQEVSEDAGTD